jgi:RNA polymerase sigma-70 factor (ECF subfamily)
MSIESPSKETVLRFKQGDVDAFEEILLMYEKVIYNYCLRIVHDTTHAKDILQDTFIKVYTHHKKIDETKNIKSWIFTIATNTAYDFLKSNKGRKSINLEEEDETFHALTSYTNREGVTTDVNEALKKLKSDYKNPILLYYKEGFDYKEIADILSLPINTIKTHISRGKSQLKQLLKDYEIN